MDLGHLGYSPSEVCEGEGRDGLSTIGAQLPLVAGGGKAQVFVVLFYRRAREGPLHVEGHHWPVATDGT